MLTASLRRFIACLLTFCLCFTMTPFAFAEEQGEKEQEVLTEEEIVQESEDEEPFEDSVVQEEEDAVEPDETLEQEKVDNNKELSGNKEKSSNEKKEKDTETKDAPLEKQAPVAALSASSSAKPAPAKPQPLKAGTYVIRSALASTKVLDIAGGSKSNGANVQLWASNMSKAQRFKVTVDAKGYYTFTNVASGKALDVSYAKKKAGTNIQQFKKKNAKAQKWVVKQNQDGSFTIHSALSTKLVLAVAGGKKKNGSNIQLAKAKGSKSQKFFFLPQNPSVSGSKTIESGVYKLQSSLDVSKVVDITGGSLKNGVSAQLYKNKTTLAQMFKITYRNDGYYTIQALNSAKALSVPFGNLVASPIEQYSLGKKIGKAKKWAIRHNSDGTYTFVSAASGMALAVKGSKAKNGALLKTAQVSGSKAQSWQLVPVGNYLDNGVYTLKSRLDQKLVAGIKEGSRKNGANVQVQTKNNAPAQKFQVTAVGTNEYTLQCLGTGKYISSSGSNVVQSVYKEGSSVQIWKVNVSKRGGLIFTNKATGKTLNVAGGKKQSGANLNLAKNKKTQAQSFLPVKVAALSKGTYTLTSAAGNRRVATKSTSTKNGLNVQVSKSSKSAIQKWTLKSAGGGYFTITNAATKKALDVKNGSSATGTNVRQWKPSKSNAQKWKAVYNGDGTYSFISACGSLALNVANNGASNGSNVNVATPNGSKAQRFKVAFAGGVTGDAWLDKQIERIAKANGYDLRRCFYYVAGYSYKSGSLHPKGNWAPLYAKQMLKNKGGNCYRFAALFCVLAQYLGYDAKVVAGWVPSASSGKAPHGWVEIRLKGTTYVCDPDLQHEISSRNWYMKTYKNAPVSYGFY